MLYAEAAYFDGDHCAHVAAWEDHRRLQRIRAEAERKLRMATTAERAAAILDAPQYLVAGEKLWNGTEVSHNLAVAYNRLTDRIEQFKMKGRRVPEELLNGRHNLIACA